MVDNDDRTILAGALPHAAPGAPDDAAPVVPQLPDPVGRVLLNTWRVTGVIARGGMGEILRATHVDQGTEHAIKVILPELMGNEGVVTLFLREAEALRRIRHDAVVGYDGLFRDETGRLHLVMEFVDGPSLADRIRQKPLTPDEVRRLRDRLAAGLAVAHEAGICHRDLAPDNVLLAGGDLDRAKIIDFGIAKLARADHRTIFGDGFAGKLAWASPEQAGLFGGAVDERTDIYSLGLVLAAAAAGRPLDMGRTLHAAVEARRKVPDLSALPEELRGDVARLLAPDPLDRPHAMRALIGGDALELPPEPARREGWSLRTLTAVGVAAVGLVLAIGFGFSHRMQASDGAVSVAMPRMEAAPGWTVADLPRIAKLPAAEMYEAGRSFYDRGDLDTALVVWERAAAEGSAPAARAIGRFYDPRLAPGEPSPFKSPDVERARAFYAKAARLGDGEAQSLFDALDGTTIAGGQG
ncbi:serine/threonine-protein kinase (plasmid) [Tistrella mobilis]|uniref:serine/threonine-protein kinase n=1 Tax=Tistrella mobilis TaxID=171437 RepID=UPI003557AB9B